MKKIYSLLVLLVFACGGSDDPAPADPPVAVNDSASTPENTAVTISVLDNDTLRNNASISDFDASSSNNGSVIELSNRLIYTPPQDFSGTDTFTYTICDGLSTPNCATATVTVTVSDLGDPVAVDDSFEVTENTTSQFTTILNNDTIVDGAELTSIDDSATSGTVVLNNDGSITYTAINGFSGMDTFTYTLCDNDATPTCATGTVNINVLDEGNPTAVDDAITVLRNQVNTISTVLNNDSVIDDAVLSSLNDSATLGTVTLNSNGTISYEPPTDFTGNDSFTYSICDDDSPNSCSTATVTLNVLAPINFNIPAALQTYYDNVLFVMDSDIMQDELEDVTKTKHTTILSYGERHNYLYNADEDLNNTDNVILMYSGESRYWEEYTSGSNSYSPQTFNTEHVYPQSLLTSDDAVTDLHHLRACDATVNSDRLNYPFADGTGTYQLIGETWYPGDEWKGDVARMMMYLNLRYGESFTRVGSIELFLKWNIEDPVSPFEEQRNTIILGAQGNRNPFIDNPYLATLIWGGENAENKWQ
ncbi:Ig-like domain-containing protein [Seonamhaeicola marinus]|uniref:Tandem-95 repeat protein n=1 Tax=Seonamhaeicola marinus TaxID=1912246 RepID=A0A5D0HFR1_9FLAO|nr:Ig-like domain-containing protein [Seonamhaeicola marinus]TYA70158.1 tandem-95 repeat protein [Seonamhaeicola marinus]